MRWLLKVMRRWPLWIRISALILTGLIVLRVVNYFAVLNTIRKGVDQIYAERLYAKADFLHRFINARRIDSAMSPVDEMMGTHPKGKGPDLWQVEYQGAIVRRSPLLGQSSLPDLGGNVSPAAGVVQTPLGEFLMVEDRRQYGDRGTLVVKIALDYRLVNKAIYAINGDRVLTYGMSVSVIMPFIVFVLWWGTLPLRRIAREVALVNSGERADLQRDYPSDVLPLIDTTNHLIRVMRAANADTSLQAMAAAHNIRSSLTKINFKIGTLVHSDAALHAEIMQDINAINHFLASHLHRLRLIRSSTSIGHAQIESMDVFMDGVFTAVQKLYAFRNLEWELGAGPDNSVGLEARELGEILFNLLDNAGKWASSKVHCAWQLADGWLDITVEDDGPGMASAAVPPAGSPNSDGLGLGLAISHELVSRRGGHLTHECSQLGGSLLRLRLPVGQIVARQEPACSFAQR